MLPGALPPKPHHQARRHRVCRHPRLRRRRHHLRRRLPRLARLRQALLRPRHHCSEPHRSRAPPADRRQPCHPLPATFRPRRSKGARGTPALPWLPAKPSSGPPGPCPPGSCPPLCSSPRPLRPHTQVTPTAEPTCAHAPVRPRGKYAEEPERPGCEETRGHAQGPQAMNTKRRVETLLRL